MKSSAAYRLDGYEARAALIDAREEVAQPMELGASKMGRQVVADGLLKTVGLCVHFQRGAHL